MKKKILSVLAVTMILTSCGLQNNTMKTFDNIDVSASPVSEAYNNYEKLLGQDFGKITMPSEITKTEFNEVYKLSTKLYKSKDIEKEGKAYFKAFFGESFDEKFSGLNGGFYCVYDNHGDSGEFGEGLYLSTGSYVPGEFKSENIKEVCKIRKLSETDKANIKIGEVSVNEIINNFESFANENLSKLNSGFDIKASDVFTYDKDGQQRTRIIGKKEYKNITFEEYESPFFQNDNNQSLTFFSASSISSTITENGDVIGISFYGNKSNPSEEKLDKMISLESAAKILQDNLAENSNYVFDDVLLMYCCKITQPFLDVTDGKDIDPKLQEELDNRVLVFEPTWYFIFDDEYSGLSRQGIKVNALTGEITMDLVK